MPSNSWKWYFKWYTIGLIGLIAVPVLLGAILLRTNLPTEVAALIAGGSLFAMVMAITMYHHSGIRGDATRIFKGWVNRLESRGSVVSSAVSRMLWLIYPVYMLNVVIVYIVLAEIFDPWAKFRHKIAAVLLIVEGCASVAYVLSQLV